MVSRWMRLDKPDTDVKFARPPWDENSDQWLEIDRRIPENHLAREIDQVVSLGDPEAACGRDKFKVFRPLYNAQFLVDLDSPFILAYDVFNRATDSGTLEPMWERMTSLTGRKPETWRDTFSNSYVSSACNGRVVKACRVLVPLPCRALSPMSPSARVHAES